MEEQAAAAAPTLSLSYLRCIPVEQPRCVLRQLRRVLELTGCTAGSLWTVRLHLRFCRSLFRLLRNHFADLLFLQQVFRQLPTGHAAPDQLASFLATTTTHSPAPFDFHALRNALAPIPSQHSPTAELQARSSTPAQADNSWAGDFVLDTGLVGKGKGRMLGPEVEQQEMLRSPLAETQIDRWGGAGVMMNMRGGMGRGTLMNYSQQSE